ncbi:MAG: membrane protein insertion efficiency factor YidD [Planctomycetia bacterium]|nr:membrane protein insertion efficiency factor YidD [Planctomycetia bacterium]
MAPESVATHGSVLRWLVHLPAMTLILLVRVYQLTISPLLGPCCRFQPSCSAYFIGAVRKHGAMRGAYRGILRVFRCHPFHPGGFDPP